MYILACALHYGTSTGDMMSKICKLGIMIHRVVSVSLGHSDGVTACNTTNALAELETTIDAATSPIVFVMISGLVVRYSSKILLSS